MTLEQLRYILEIAYKGSMNKAALSLNVTQPNLSAAIKNLEEELGYDVFVRSRQGVMLTPKGKRLIQYAQNIQTQLELMKYIDDGLSETQLTFSVTSQFTSGMIDIMRRLCEEYDAQKYLFYYDQKPLVDVVVDVVNKKADIGVVSYGESKRDYYYHLFSDNNLRILNSNVRYRCMAVTKTHPLFGREQIDLKELQEYPLIALDIAEKTFMQTELLDQVGWYEHKRKVIVQDLLHLYYMCDKLNGITIINSGRTNVINKVLEGYNMEYKLFPLHELERSILSCICLKDKSLRSIERRFLAEVEDVFSEH